MIKPSGPDLYKFDLQDHAKNPRNFGLLTTFDFCSAQLNPSCGDSVTVCGLIESGVVAKLSFEGVGCVLSLAMASKLTEHVVGMQVPQALSLDDATVEQLLGLELGINRLACGMLSIRALRQGISQWQQKQGLAGKI